MAVNINTLITGTMTLGAGGSTPSEPTAPNGKVLYKTGADREWLQSNADITDGAFSGFTEKSSAVAVIIPSKDASGNDVTSIGDYAFFGSGLTSVTIPSSVTSIGDGALSYCSELTSVTIPDSVTNIGEESFYNCDKLTSVTITANGGNAENVKQMVISAISLTSISDNITWNMPS